MEFIQQIISMAYPIALPIFFILMAIEIYIGYKDNRQSHELTDSAVSVTTGLVFVGMGFFTKTFKILIFFFVYENFRLFTIDYTIWWTWVILFLLEDFTFYWGHRMGHMVSFYWASHVVHHSSERYNFATAMRKTWTYDITGHFLLWCWLPLIGFHPLHMVAIMTVSFIYQFWLHTEKVGFMPNWFEYFFNTPSHHRVHHSSNVEYLDKNLGGVLIIFDRWFGTFQKEEETCIYGLTKNIKTRNLLIVEFHEWKDLLAKAFSTRSLITGFKYLIKPPGWSPDGSSMTTAQLRKELAKKRNE